MHLSPSTSLVLGVDKWIKNIEKMKTKSLPQRILKRNADVVPERGVPKVF